MSHSYEGLDRAGGVDRTRMLAPLRHRDYRLAFAGLTVSLLGDGIFLVALAWQVYAIADAPAALGAIGIAMSVPTIACLLLGGAVADRGDRRRLMLLADLARALALGGLALLSLLGTLRLEEIAGIAVLYGIATAFFDPAADALVPELLPGQALPAANALDQLVRPLALRIAGPGLGGAAVALVGPGGAFAADAASFALSALALSAMRRPAAAVRAAAPRAVHGEVLDGLRYVAARPWLWVTLASAALAYLLFMGPVEVLLPYLVRDQLHEGAGHLGVILAVGGAGSLVCAIVLGGRGLPRRLLTFTYLAWTAATLGVAGYGLARSDVGLAVASLAFNALETAGTITWITLKQRLVPGALLGRVSSLDWLISIGLLPVSYGLAGPVSALLGIRTTLVGAGVLGAAVTAAGLLVPGVRNADAEASEGMAHAGETAPPLGLTPAE